ncbi:MAG: CpaF family protein, partial [bacterium]
MPSGESERSRNDTPPQRSDGSETFCEEAIVRKAVQSLPQILHPQKQGRRVSCDEDLMAEAEKALYRHILESLPPSVEAGRIESLTRRALTISLGLGPLEEWLHDPEVSEIMINGTRSVYLERGGTLEKMASPYQDEDAIRRLVDRILAPLGRRVDEKAPYVDGRLPDGSRVNVVIPPASLDGPVVTVRKFSGEWLSISHLVSRGSLSSEAASFLEAAVRKRRNILISGGTGTGKTTLLNALASFVGSGERVITIEDAAELDLQQEHVIRLETRPPNMEGQGEITTRSLV